MYEPHIVKSQVKSKNTNSFAIYASVTSLLFLERLAKVIPYDTLATTVPFYNIFALCNRNKK